MAALRRKLSDEELTEQLREHGITTPVTATTRNLLTKKLNHILASNKRRTPSSSTPNNTARGNKRAASASSPSRTLLQSLSSDEDEEEGAETSNISNLWSRRRSSRDNPGSQNGASRRSGRLTPTRESSGGGGVISPLSRARVNGGLIEGDSSSAAAYSSSLNESGVRRRSRTAGSGSSGGGTYFPVSMRSGITPTSRMTFRDYDTGSDSDLAEEEEGEENSVVEDRSRSNKSRTSSSSAWNGPPGGDGEEEALPNNSNSNSIKNRVYQNHNSLLNHRSHVTNDVRNNRNSSQNCIGNGGQIEGGRSDHGGRNVRDESRINNATETLVSQTCQGEHDPQVRVANGRHHSEVGDEPQVEPCDESSWHYSIPLLLLILLVVFFGVLAMLYVNMRMPLLPTLRSVPAMLHQIMANLPVPFLSPGHGHHPGDTAVGKPAKPKPSVTVPPPPTSPGPENKFPVCSDVLKTDCLTVKETLSVQPLLGQMEGVLLPALYHQAGLYQCGNSPLKHLTVQQMTNLLHQGSQVMSDTVEGIKSLGKLVEWNSHWGIITVRGKDHELLGLALSSQPTHILCHIKAAIYSFVYLLLAVFTAGVAGWLVFTFVRYRRRKAEEEKQEVFDLVEQILQVLRSLRGSSGKDYVAVSHVRDSLIGPRDRRNKKNTWDKAVQFIDHFESRVRREVQSVGEEDCEVWRWASSVPHSPSDSAVMGDGNSRHPPAKVWQGQAFDDLETTHNLPQVSPTSCLKIRNMFDCDVEFGESWPSRIQDSILEKCEGISIVHVAVDRGSREGCVYLMCASSSEAGLAFRALHGWWYDGNLVTVKFLRHERYLQRFPSARYATRRLRPSNNKRLSMQVCKGQIDPTEQS